MIDLNARIHELQNAISDKFNQHIQASLGTATERKVMTRCLDQAVDMMTELSKIMIEGMTFEKWSAYYRDLCLNTEYMTDIVDGREEMEAMYAELKSLDLREHYDTVIEPHTSLPILQRTLDEMTYNRSAMLEIWAEEDAEKETA